MQAEYLHIISQKTKDVPTIVVILLVYNTVQFIIKKSVHLNHEGKTAINIC